MPQVQRQGAKISVEKFSSGDAFLNAHISGPFDVVFLDIDTPEVSGFDVAERISEKALFIIRRLK